MDQPAAHLHATNVLRVLSRHFDLSVIALPAGSNDRHRSDCAIEAWSNATGERWRVTAPSFPCAVEVLAEQVGLEIG